MLIRIFTYIKNEQELLPRWLNHHLTIIPGYLIHVVDNGSTDSTLDILQQYKDSHGIHIHHHNNYKHKGNETSSHILKYKAQPGISIPLDGDEFLAILKNNQVNVNGSDIKDYIESLPLDCGHYSTLGCLNSIPEKENYTDPVRDIDKFKWVWKNATMCKKFYSNQTFKRTCHGNHHSGNKQQPGKQTDIVYLHYHDTGRDAMLQRCELNVTGLDINIDELKHDSNNGADIHAQSFTGIERAVELIELPTREYKPTDVWDVKFQWPG